MRWGGVISFYASEHAMRGERVLERAGVAARLVPGPREVSPNCGVAVAFRWDDEADVERALAESKVRYEAIHRYELDESERCAGRCDRGRRCEGGCAVKKLFARRWVVVVTVIAAFVIALGAVGLVSRSTSSTAAPAVTVAPATTPTLPAVTWYWTMAVSPTDPNVLALGTSSGVYRSADGGKTWTQTGLKGINTTSVVQSGNSFFAAGVHSAFTAGPVVTTTKGGLKERSAPPGPAVFATSTDGGKTWQTIRPAGLPKVAVQSLSVDPSNSRTIYAITTSGEFFKSTDGARTFAIVSPKLGIPPWALAVTHGTNFVSGDMDNGSHVSANGMTWTSTPFTDGRGTDMVMDVTRSQARRPTKRVIMSSIGIQLSTDGGKTWSHALPSTVMFGPIAWASGSSGVAYAAGFDGSLWHSTDAGKTWTPAT